MSGLKPRRRTSKPQRKPTTEELYGPDANVVNLDSYRKTKALMTWADECLENDGPFVPGLTP